MAEEITIVHEDVDAIVARNIAEVHQERFTFGQRLADSLAAVAGSWGFIGGFIALLIAWTVVNLVLPAPDRWDPYPFILLNLVLSCLAALQAPVIMMSQDRQEARDRLRDEQDFRVNLKAELEVAQLQAELAAARAELAELRGLEAQRTELLARLVDRLTAESQGS